MLKTNALFSALFGMLAIQPPAPASLTSKRKTRARTPGAKGKAGDKLARYAAEARIGGRAA